VLDSITNLFWSKGYNGTSVDDLVQASGLSRSSLYDSFGDKHGLYLRALQHYRQKNAAMLKEDLKKITSPKKRIRHLFNGAVAHILADDQRKGCFVVNATTELSGHDAGAAALSCANMQEMEASFTQWVAEGQKTGEISNHTPARAIGRYLYSSFCGLRVVGQTNPDKKMLDDIVKVTLSILDA
jgi:TetR/AcrR family transcriptional regulator, transcriptional repressor for nem operon